MKDSKPLEELQKEFYQALTWYFSEKSTPTGFYNAVGQIRDHLKELNNNLLSQILGEIESV